MPFQNYNYQKGRFIMKKMIALALSAVMALSLVACGGKGNTVDDNANIVGDDPATWEPTITIDSEQKSDIEIPDPFSVCSSLEEAAQNAGFSFNVPEAVDGYTQRIIRTMAGEEGSAMIEVIYQNEIDGKENTDSADEIRMRKANGDEDISGDYTEYSETSSLTVGNIQVTVKGGHGNINLATWTDNGYTYSIGVYSETGITAEEMSDFIAAVK